MKLAKPTFLTITFTALLWLPPIAFSRIEHTSISYKPSVIIIPTADVSVFDQEITVYFRSFDERDNSAESYKVGFSINQVPDGSGFFWEALPNLPEGQLTNWMRSSITTSTVGTLNLGSWSTQSATPANGIEPTSVIFTLKLKKSGIEQIFEDNTNPSLNFHIVAADIDPPIRYWSSTSVSIPIQQADMVKISNLKDVDLSGEELSKTFNACAYSSTGKASITLSSKNSISGEAFKLSNYATPPEEPSYSVTISAGGTTQTFITESDHLNQEWDVSRAVDQDCITNGNNTTFTVTVDNIPSVAGTYKDTITVTLGPK